jgi:hypothetical protein
MHTVGKRTINDKVRETEGWCNGCRQLFVYYIFFKVLFKMASLLRPEATFAFHTAMHNMSFKISDGTSKLVTEPVDSLPDISHGGVSKFVSGQPAQTSRGVTGSTFFVANFMGKSSGSDVPHLLRSSDEVPAKMDRGGRTFVRVS